MIFLTSAYSLPNSFVEANRFCRCAASAGLHRGASKVSTNFEKAAMGYRSIFAAPAG
jgi:hypothetical protein